MKPPFQSIPGANANVCRPSAAFTLVEIMIAMALFGMLMAGVLSAHLFGMRLYRITETKLSATASARNALNQVRDEIRSGKMLLVGTGDASSFTTIPDNSNHVGNALQIYGTANTNSFVRFFLDSSDGRLKRLASGSSDVRVVASYITNQVAFLAEDFRGNVLTNNQNNRVIHLTLDFYQWEFPLATAGPGAMYDYFSLHTRLTRRSIE